MENLLSESSQDHTTKTQQQEKGEHEGSQTMNVMIPFHGEKEKKKKSISYWILLFINYACLFIGSISSSLLSRFYFIHGGSSKWVSTWIQSSGFPLLLIPIYLSSLFYSKTKQRPFSLFTRKLLLKSLLIGVLMGINNFLFSWGISYLSVSTSSLLLSSQLAFNLILSVLLVKQKVTFTNLNSVILLTLSSVLLALASSHDRPKGVTKTNYFMGFFAILGAGLLFSLYLPLMEMVYKKVNSYQMAMEMQVVMEMAATVFATIGLVSDGGYKEMRNESGYGFNLGPLGYWLTIGFNIVSWQMCFMGTAGLVFLTTSLTGGVCMTALLPMNVVAGVVAYGDDFSRAKVISTLMCFWGFCSYVYGEYINMKKKKVREEGKDENGISFDAV